MTDKQNIPNESNDGTETVVNPAPAPEPNGPPETPKESPKEEPKEEPKETPAQEEQAKEEVEATEEPKSDELELEYPVYNNEVADSIVSMLKAANVKPQDGIDIFKEANETGDISKINHAKLEELVGKDKATLIVAGLEKFYNTALTQQRETIKAVHDIAGGEASFQTMVEWAKVRESKDPEFKAKLDELRKMLPVSRTAAELAVRELKSFYDADPQNKSLNVKIERGTSSVNTDFKPIDRSEYIRELKIAHARGDVARVRELDARRKYTIAKQGK